MNRPALGPEPQPPLGDRLAPASVPPATTGVGLEPARCPVPGTIDSASLLRGSREALIVHAGEIYRLRLTRNGKLLLTK